MTETVREVSRFERLLTLALTDSEIDSAKGAAARRLAKDLKIPGFRPGKAPRPVVEAAVGPERLRSEAIEDLIPKKLGEILTEAKLAPAVTPTLEKVGGSIHRFGDVRQDHGGARFGESARHRRAEPLPGAGDEGGPPVQ